ncbi:SpoIIE family protein phosphatase [Streptomyces sp. NPDC059690]|uniref:SpoIIE family protein phosphatase n=1 Tax=Streptomyces sp. NPDC059690 TaxID=3346907 RepID=UPI00369D7270
MGEAAHREQTAPTTLPSGCALPNELIADSVADAGPPLGVNPDLPRPDHEETLPAGSAILLHTDGLVGDRAHALGDGMRQAADTAARHATPRHRRRSSGTPSSPTARMPFPTMWPCSPSA